MEGYITRTREITPFHVQVYCLFLGHLLSVESLWPKEVKDGIEPSFCFSVVAKEGTYKNLIKVQRK